LVSAFLLITLCACSSSIAAKAEPAIEAPVSLSQIRPETPYAEVRGDLTRLNFDFELENTGPEDVEITFVGMRVFDATGQILQRRYMGGNGLPGPIAMLGDRTIPAQGSKYIFNPFPDLALSAPADHADIVVAYTGGLIEFTVQFHPVTSPILPYLPIASQSYVYSGSDLFAHHRRVALNSEPARALGMEHITQRFALDFTRLDLATGGLYVEDGAEQEDWLGFGIEVIAPIDGTVVFSRSDMPDNHFDEAGQRVFVDDFQTYGEDRGLGNYLILDIGNGIHLLMSHFRQGTLTVNIGDTVKAGQLLGQIGMTGDTAYPHLHMQLQDGADFLTSRPLPMVFACVDFVGREQKAGAIDTGDLVAPCE
jgi:hypothetical protein